MMSNLSLYLVVILVDNFVVYNVVLVVDVAAVLFSMLSPSSLFVLFLL